MAPKTASTPSAILSLSLGEGALSEFFPLFQQGVTIRAHTGRSVADFLCDQIGLDPGYVRERITTIFLNGKAIDDVNLAILKAGSTLALSGAMPGLVGATMRRGGYYAAMRSGITHTESGVKAEERIDSIRVKLFNLLLPELGPLFLRQGIILTPAELAEFLSVRFDSIHQECVSAHLNGAPVQLHTFVLPPEIRAFANFVVLVNF